MCVCVCVCMYMYIGLVGRVFTNGSGDQGSISGQAIPKKTKMVLDAAWHNTQHYKVCIQGGTIQG